MKRPGRIVARGHPRARMLAPCACPWRPSSRSQRQTRRRAIQFGRAWQQRNAHPDRLLAVVAALQRIGERNHGPTTRGMARQRPGWYPLIDFAVAQPPIRRTSESRRSHPKDSAQKPLTPCSSARGIRQIMPVLAIRGCAPCPASSRCQCLAGSSASAPQASRKYPNVVGLHR